MIIPRAVLLLILDEVTSSVDVWTEELIQKLWTNSWKARLSLSLLTADHYSQCGPDLGRARWK